MLLVTTATALPGTTGVRRTRFDPGLFLAVVSAAVTALLGILAWRIRFLVQRSFFGGWRWRRSLGRLSSSLLLGKLCRLGCYRLSFGLLTHTNQLRFTRLLRFQLALLNIAQLIMATILLLTGTQLGLTDDGGASRRGYWSRRCNLRCRGNLNNWNLNHRLGNRLRLWFNNWHDLNHRLRNQFWLGSKLNYGNVQWHFFHISNHCFLLVIAHLSLDQYTLLAHLYLNGTSPAMRIGRLNF